SCAAEGREHPGLLVGDRAWPSLGARRVPDLGRWIAPADALVLNETRVRPARLTVRRPTGGKVELLFVRPESSAAGEAWRVLARPARPAIPGQPPATPDGAPTLEVGGEGEAGGTVARGPP